MDYSEGGVKLLKRQLRIEHEAADLYRVCGGVDDDTVAMVWGLDEEVIREIITKWQKHSERFRVSVDWDSPEKWPLQTPVADLGFSNGLLRELLRRNICTLETLAKLRLAHKERLNNVWYYGSLSYDNVRLFNDKQVQEICKRVARLDMSELKDKEWEDNDEIGCYIDREQNLRMYNVLKRSGIDYIFELAALTAVELKRLKGVGRSMVQSIEGYLHEYGLALAETK